MRTIRRASRDGKSLDWMCPTMFYIHTDKCHGTMILEQGIAQSRTNVQELIECAQEHLRKFPTDADVNQFNARQQALWEEECARSRSSDKVTQPKASTFIYLCRNNRNSLIKIGLSHNPKQREATLQSEEPDVEFIHIQPGDLTQEKALHERFTNRRVRGEWFRLSDSDIKEIKKGALSA